MKMWNRFTIVPLAVCMAMGLVAGCGGVPADAPKSADAASKPAPPPMEVKLPDVAPPASAAGAAMVEPQPGTAAPTDATQPNSETPASTPAAPAAAPGPALDATTIIGTKWSAGGYTLAFQENGVIKINDDTEGTYKIDGNKLSIEAGGTVYDSTLEGDKIMYEGMPLEKL